MNPPLDAAAELVKVTYPDPLFRPIPTFSIDVPPDWLISEFPDSLFVMGPPADSGGEWSNVVVRHERLLPSASLDEIARETWAELKGDFPDAVLKDERMITAGNISYVREAELTMPETSELISRIDSFTFGPVVDQPTVDLFQITWMNPASAADDLKVLYLRMLASLQFEA